MAFWPCFFFDPQVNYYDFYGPLFIEGWRLWIVSHCLKIGTGCRLTKLKQCECFHETLHFPGTSFTHGCMKVSFWSCSCFHVDASQKVTKKVTWQSLTYSSEIWVTTKIFPKQKNIPKIWTLYSLSLHIYCLVVVDIILPSYSNMNWQT